MTTSTPIAESKLFRVVGIRMPSAAQQQAAQQAMIARLHLATRNGEMDWTQLNVPSNPVSAVYEDESGARFVGMSTPFGPQMIEFDNAPEFDPMSDASDGGFLSLDRLSSMSSNQGAAQPMMMSTLTADAAKSLMSKPMSDGGPSITESILKSMAMGIGQQAVGSALVNLASGKDTGLLVDKFVASTTTTAGLTQLGQSLASGLISNVIGMGVSAAMSKWEVDDESSTAEHAAKKAAEAMVGKIQSELMSLIDEQIANALGTAGPAQAPVPPGSSPKSLTDKIAEFFTGPTSTANVPVGCIGCGNTNDGIALTGGPTVIVGGLPVSRLSDKVTMTKPIPDIGPLMSGNPTVLSLSLPTAGDGHVAVGGKGVVTLLQNCAATVLMGPQGMPVMTPTPKETAIPAASTATESSAKGSASKSPEKQPVVVPEEKSVQKSESGSKQQISTLQDYGKPDAQSMKEMSEGAYNDRKGDTTPNGKWEAIQRVTNESNGFKAVIYKSTDAADPRHVLSFAGTDFDLGNAAGLLEFAKDLDQDLLQAAGGLPTQYRIDAIKTALAFSSQYGTDGYLTGHSLGGGLATFTGLIFGMPSTVFNPALLGNGAISYVYKHGEPNSWNQIEVYSNVGDVVSTSDQISVGTPVGVYHTIVPHNPASLGNHLMSTMSPEGPQLGPDEHNALSDPESGEVESLGLPFVPFL